MRASITALCLTALLPTLLAGCGGDAAPDGSGSARGPADRSGADVAADGTAPSRQASVAGTGTLTLAGDDYDLTLTACALADTGTPPTDPDTPPTDSDAPPTDPDTPLAGTDTLLAGTGSSDDGGHVEVRALRQRKDDMLVHVVEVDIAEGRGDAVALEATRVRMPDGWRGFRIGEAGRVVLTEFSEPLIRVDEPHISATGAFTPRDREAVRAERGSLEARCRV